MIAISKKEATTVRKFFPDVHIIRTCKQKSKRHHYYMEENWKAVKLVNRLRDGDNDEFVNKNDFRRSKTGKKGSVRNNSRKTS